MDGGDRVIRRRKSLTERLGLKGIGCCGSTWGIMPATTFNVVDNEDENDDVEVLSHHIHTPPETPSATTTCLAVVAGGGGGSSGMNLAAALAAERHFRADNDNNNEVNIHPGSRPGPNSRPGPTSPLRADESGLRNVHNNEVNGSRPGPNSNSGLLRPDESGLGDVPETPTRMSLMRLLEETEVYEGELLMEEEGVGVGNDSVCCVCMRRKKGAAFIPCGHTFCRVCSRELWVNRGCCPLCNRSILEILDIY